MSLRNMPGWLPVIAVALSLAACAGPATLQPEIAAPAEGAPPADVTQAAEPAVGGAPTVAPQDPSAATVPPEAAPAEDGFEPRPHRAAPAPPDVFTEDSAEFFAATGAPQMVEIFTYW